MKSFERNPEDKKAAILEASIVSVAKSGTNCSTREIAKKAKVSEGTIFNYFCNKSGLINTLYLSIKNSLCAYIFKNHLLNSSANFWEVYLEWGFKNPASAKALCVIETANILTEETRAEASEILEAIFYSETLENPKEIYFFKSLLDIANSETLKIVEVQNEFLRESYKKIALSMLCNLYSSKEFHLFSFAEKVKPVLDLGKLPPVSFIETGVKENNVLPFSQASHHQRPTQIQIIKEAANA